MSRDAFHSFLLRAQGVVIGAVETTDVCREAQRLHDLGSTACIALGRLLSSTALVASMQKRRGLLSLQIVGRGQLRQLFADMTQEGHLRGYVRNPHIGFPLAPDENPELRLAVGHGIMPGSCSMIREPERSDFVQSTTDLISGEIDTDVESAVRMSDQIVTSLTCDVLLDDKLTVRYAGGIILQPLPHGDVPTLNAMAASLRDGGLAKRLLAHKGDILAVLKEVAPEAEAVEETQPIIWKCRCSMDRVRSALRMLTAHDLTDMIAKGSPAEVTCDFCGTVYKVDVHDMQAAHDALIATQN
jgi:molecular chaperone Hsp33